MKTVYLTEEDLAPRFSTVSFQYVNILCFKEASLSKMKLEEADTIIYICKEIGEFKHLKRRYSTIETVHYTNTLGDEFTDLKEIVYWYNFEEDKVESGYLIGLSVGEMFGNETRSEIRKTSIGALGEKINDIIK